MTTFARFGAYAVLALAVLLGAGSVMAFLLFLLTGSPEMMSLNFRVSEVLWWDAGLSIAFFIQHSGMVRRSFRRRLSRFLPEKWSLQK